MDKAKLPNSNRRGKRTIAKEKLYKNILKNIRTIYPNFNIGVSTSYRNNFANKWKDPYRHWCFKSKDNTFDPSLTKNKNSVHPTQIFHALSVKLRIKQSSLNRYYHFFI